MFSTKFAFISLMVAVFSISGSMGLMCKECHNFNCPNPWFGPSNITCFSGNDYCIKLDVSTYMYRGCAKESHCDRSGAGLIYNDRVGENWRKIKETLGDSYVSDQLAKGKVVHCCRGDLCNGASELPRAVLVAFLGLLFTILI